MNTGIVVVGLVLIVVGILFGWLFCLGVLLVPVGFIVMIVGLVMKDEPRTVVQYYGGQAPGMYPIQGPPSRGPYISPEDLRYCQYCGKAVHREAEWCPGCGRALLKQSGIPQTQRTDSSEKES